LLLLSIALYYNVGHKLLFPSDTSSSSSSDNKKVTRYDTVDPLLSIKEIQRYEAYYEKIDPFEILSENFAIIIPPDEKMALPPTSPPPDDDGLCSCWNTTESCCERDIHPNHKFGWALTTSLFKPKKFDIQIHIRNEHAIRPPTDYYHRNSIDIDYRGVFITRNLQDAFVSGFLYHKSGMYYYYCIVLQ